MSRPASSCSLSQSRVASRFARASSPPCARHAGQSLWVSASQSGFGRLPAMVVSNIFLSSCRDAVTATKSLRLTIIDRYKEDATGRLRVFGMVVGTFCSFVMGIFNPYVVNKAGPDWWWGGGRNDMVRNLYFRPNGSFRRYGRVALLVTLVGGSAALFWILK